MTRVSSFGYNQSMINSMLLNQNQMMKAQQQVDTGHKASSYTDMGRDISPLLGAKTVQSQVDAYLGNTNSVLDKLNFNDLYLGNLYDQTDSLHSAMLDGLSSDSFSSFGETLDQTFDSVVGALNAQVGGVYIFGGTRSNEPPVKVTSLADLAALPSVDDAFQNSTVKPSATVDAGVSVQYGMLASDVGKDVLQALKNLAEFQAGPDGPLDGTLTDDQRTFVQGQLQTIESAMKGVTASQAENGIRTTKMTDLRDSHEATQTTLQTFIGNIQDVDMASAVTNLQQNMLALQASMQVVGQLSQLSLLDYM
jgi:flagellar hook-associated protein 3 FlgL